MQAVAFEDDAGKTRISALDARVKIVSVVAFCFVAALARELAAALGALIFVVVIALISGISIKRAVKRYAIACAFIVLASLSMFFSAYISSQEVHLASTNAFVLFLRASSCVGAAIVLIGSTTEDKLLYGLRGLGLPDVLVKTMFFTQRYMHVISEERERMALARRARLFDGGGGFQDRLGMSAISSALGMLLVRSYRRGGRIYDAMLARCYDGVLPENATTDEPPMYLSNASFACAFAVVCTTMLCMQYVL